MCSCRAVQKTVTIAILYTILLPDRLMVDVRLYRRVKIAQVILHTAGSMMLEGDSFHSMEKSTCHLKTFEGPADLQEICHGFCAVWGVEGTA